ncbi:MAG: Vitamin B12-dependent ribonucleoside-diphosphate reductase [Alphaproteobacteria bacterium MarineAlpha3_Bin5]|nr:MAG: Vitamin B12-dependent ribonucleoside-diphosphate reductase [Alphaproteobacteria bacterium MarineAlpha3_Bin5]
MANVSAISQQIWDMKYRLKTSEGRPIENNITDTWHRVSKTLASIEKDPIAWEQNFFSILEDFKFLPAGRILAGAGSKRKVTLFNCFVMGTIPDDISGIFQSLKEAALTMQQGGGIGYDFSTLRPKGAPVKGVGADASGPLSFMDVWDSMCRTIMSAGSRRGAMMATLRCDHPDIEHFIEAKEQPDKLRMFNLSVLVTDKFMQAIKENSLWELKFDGITYKTLPARVLWEKIMNATFNYAEPGVIFIDRVNRQNNLNYCEKIQATNPCGEQPLPPYGACLLGSINLTKLVCSPFSNKAALNLPALENIVTTAVRMLDNVIDVSDFPISKQDDEARSKRRIGLGVTGLGDALIMCGARYGSDRSIELAKLWMKTIQRTSYLSSIELSREKGPFPKFDKEAFLKGGSIKLLDQDIVSGIYKHGIRNALLTSIAPTGTISLLADNVSSGIEPVFNFVYKRRVLLPDGSSQNDEVSDYAYSLYRSTFGNEKPLSDAFINIEDLSPDDHLTMQAAIQEYVDSSISKTINVPENISFTDFKGIYEKAFDLNCKGCTTYRPNEVTGAILTSNNKKTDSEPQLPLECPSVEKKARNGDDSSSIIYITKPLDRPRELQGITYKVRWPDSEHAIYITINDVVEINGRARPFEIFINTKNTEHFAWTVALTRMISAVFRRGGDVSFVVEELKAVFDPRGGQWVKGKYVPSLLAAIGNIIEQHMVDIGFLQNAENKIGVSSEKNKVSISNTAHNTPGNKVRSALGPFRQCPRCGDCTLSREEGCDTCRSCGFSKCS